MSPALTSHYAPPRWLMLPAVIGAGLVLIPVAALFSRIPWAELPQLLLSESALTALRLSLGTAAVATVLCVALGVPLALMMSRVSSTVIGVLRALILLPLVLPPVVGGIALLYTFGRQGALGGFLEAWGIQIAYSTAAVVVAQTFVAMPFLVLSVETSLRELDSDVLDAAALDGASRTAILRLISLPLILPGLVTGVILAFARALGEFGATLAFAGSLQGVTRTLPLEIFLARESDPDAAVALSALLVVTAVAVIGLAYGRLSASHRHT